eukprot:5742148-Amphidinium_carterae.1
MAEQWQRSPSECERTTRNSPGIVQEEVRSVSVCSSAPRSSHSIFLARLPPGAPEGTDFPIPAVAGCADHNVGCAFLWPHGDERLEGGADDCGGHGCSSGERHRGSDGYSLPAHPGDSGGQTEEQYLGESGEIGAHSALKWWELGEQRAALPCKLVTSFVSQGGELRELLRSPSSSAASVMLALHRLVRKVGSPHAGIGTLASRGLEAQHGVSPMSLFPVPLLRLPRVPPRGRKRLRGKRRLAICALANMMLEATNWMHEGDGSAVVSSSAPPSRAQARMQQQHVDVAVRFLRAGSNACCGDCTIRQYLRSQQSYSSVDTVAIPLGSQAGVPSRAGQVDLSAVLEETFPELAQQVREPSALLLPPADRPPHVPTGFASLASDYETVVQKAVAAGLQDMASSKQVVKHPRGKRLLVNGAFAVPKNADESRWICNCTPLNALLDPSKVPRPRFAYIPAVRTVTTRRHKTIRVWKRDARHYFHNLKLGRRWRKYLAMPRVRSKVVRCFPRHCTVPMGMGPAAGWAQAATDVATNRAGLPQHSRVRLGDVPPIGLPIWASILDDVWGIEETDVNNTPSLVDSWMSAIDDEWPRMGVEVNANKSVNAAIVEEVQGVQVDGVTHLWEVALSKRFLCFVSVLFVLFIRRPPLRMMERLVGKLGFIMSLRPAGRSTLFWTYRWMGRCKDQDVLAAALPQEVAVELLTAALLLPHMYFNTSLPWTQRVVCSDAAPGGHGLAWAHWPATLVRDACRLSDTKGARSFHSVPGGLLPDADSKVPLHRVNLPLKGYSWTTAARRGGYSHIGLEECDAAVWGLSTRLRYPGEQHTRVLHPTDSATVAGAFSKGRSSSFWINIYCRRVAAVQLSYDLFPFFPWVSTHVNPADEPSSRFGIRADKPIQHPIGERSLPSHKLVPHPSHVLLQNVMDSQP